MVAITRILRPHLGQRSTSNPKVRFIITAHSRRLDQANSSPSSRRPQCATVIIVGATTTTGSAGTAARVSEAASLGADETLAPEIVVGREGVEEIANDQPTLPETT